VLMKKRPEALCYGAELTLRISVAGLSLLPLGCDRKERLQNLLIKNAAAGCGTYFRRRKKTSKPKAVSTSSRRVQFKLGGRGAQFRYQRWLLEKGVTPCGMWKLCGMSLGCVFPGVDFVLS